MRSSCTLNDVPDPSPAQLESATVTSVAFAVLMVISITSLASLTWMRWTDPLVDFGAQLYHASRVAHGEWPYRDFATYNGPLSVWINGCWLWAVGDSLTSMVALNAVLATLLGGLLWEAMRRTGSPATGWVAILIFVWLFAFQRLVRANCFNYLCPYSHEHFHGLVVTFSGLLLLDSANARTPWIIAAGVCLGAVFLTKAENTLAAWGSAAVLVALRWLDDPRPVHAKATSLATLLASASAPIAVAWMALAAHMPLATATLGLCGSWPLVFRPDIQSLPFFRSSMGTDDILVNSLALAGASATVVLPLLGLDRFTQLSARSRWPALLFSVGIGFLGCVILLQSAEPAHFLFRGIPIWMVCFLLLHRWAWITAANEPLARERAAWSITLVVMASLLLAKISLNCRVSHYGFILAMPAVVVTGGCLWNGWRSPDAPYTRACGLAILTAAVMSLHFNVFRVLLAAPPVLCGQGRDRFFGDDERAAAVHAASEWLRVNTRPDDTVVVMPEGALINYLSRRKGGKFVNFMPPEVMFFGEETILNEFRRQPPTYILLAPKNMKEWGVRFGESHLRNTLEWLNDRYAPVTVLGDPQSPYRISVYALK